MDFNLTRVRILGTHQCGKEQCEAFKRQGNLNEILCRQDYADQVVSSLHIKYNMNTMVEIGLYLLD